MGARIGGSFVGGFEVKDQAEVGIKPEETVFSEGGGQALEPEIREHRFRLGGILSIFVAVMGFGCPFLRGQGSLSLDIWFLGEGEAIGALWFLAAAAFFFFLRSYFASLTCLVFANLVLSDVTGKLTWSKGHLILGKRFSQSTHLSDLVGKSLDLGYGFYIIKAGLFIAIIATLVSGLSSKTTGQPPDDD